MGNFNWGLMKGKSDLLPNQDLITYFAMAGYDLAASIPDASVILFAGAGGATLQAKPEGAESVSETNFAINGGLKGYFWVSPKFGLTAGANVGYAFTSESGTDVGNTLFFPVTAGIAVRF